MSKTFRSLDDVDVKGKRVLVRVDLNVPMENGRVTDATRLERVASTIIEISGKGGKVILLSHLGRPKGRDPRESLKPVAAALAEVIGKPVAFADDCIGEAAQKAVAAMKDGDILCLENTRFHKEEENNDPTCTTARITSTFTRTIGPPMPTCTGCNEFQPAFSQKRLQFGPKLASHAMAFRPMVNPSTTSAARDSALAEVKIF